MILEGDCIEQMATLEPESVDAIVTDPPYGLGFMGKEWDDLPPGDAFAIEALRVLKPGGHLLAFGGTRTYHRLACAIEDVGFEIRDSLIYMYGSGFPKSLNLDRLRGEAFCGCGDDDMHGVRPGVPDAGVLAQAGEGADVLSAVQRQAPSQGGGSARAQGPSGLDRGEPGELPREDERRAQPGLEGRGDDQATKGQLPRRASRPGASVGASDGEVGRVHSGASVGDGGAGRAPADASGSGASPRPRPREQHRDEPGAMADERLAQDGRGWPDCARCGLPIVPRGLGTALKPAHEPIVVARKPLAGTVAANVLEHGTGALNIDGCRIGNEGATRATETPGGVPGVSLAGSASGALNGNKRAEPLDAGRWPANVVLSPEAAAELDEQSGDEQSRFFYCAKASSAERNAGLDGAGTGDSKMRVCQCPKSQADIPRPRDTDAAIVEAECDSSTTGSGSKSTGRSPRATKSTTETGIRPTTGSKTSNSSPRPSTSESTPSTTGEPASPGSGDAQSAANGSEPTPSTSTSASGVGSFTDAVDPVTSPESSATSSVGSRSSCPDCGGVVDGGRRNVHPLATVKPISLMRWLVRLVTPPGGRVLDPFLGSGTTGAACMLEGFDFIGIEREAEYREIAEARIAHWSQYPGAETTAVLASDRRTRKTIAPEQTSLLNPEHTEIDPTGYLTGDAPPYPGQISILEEVS